MNRLVSLFAIAIIPLLIASCHRKAVHKNHPDFVGFWSHKDTNGEEWYIDISEKSWGTITVYDAGGGYSKEHLYGENPHRWRYNEKKQELTHRLIPERFKVNKLPTITETTIINGFDTIPPGRTYCIIEFDYYIRKE